MQRWLATAKAPCIRGGQLRPTYRGGSRPQARSLAARHLQGRPTAGRRLQGATANGQPAGGCRPWPRLPPVRAAAPVIGATTPW
ncbi:hypothetical protein BHM03_00057796 [Ensete ventricosum]|nr:hypothetical protein BHM03_00057796 [Ensete ventricosum]